MKVSVLIATYGTEGENQKYLDLCLKSLDAQTYQNKEIILVSSGYEPKHPDHVFSYHSPKRLHYPEAIMKAAKFIAKDSEIVLLCNDDIIAHKSAISEMVNVLEQQDLILNPLSNCDNGKLFVASLLVKDLTEKYHSIGKHQYKYEEIAPLADDIIERTFLQSPILFFINWAAFYFTAFRRSTWDRLGGLDVNFQSGQDDLDTSMRAHALGIRCALITSAYVHHFSGATADVHLTPEIRAANIEYFNKKWSQSGTQLK